MSIFCIFFIPPLDLAPKKKLGKKERLHLHQPVDSICSYILPITHVVFVFKKNVLLGVATTLFLQSVWQLCGKNVHAGFIGKFNVSYGHANFHMFIANSRRKKSSHFQFKRGSWRFCQKMFKMFFGFRVVKLLRCILYTCPVITFVFKVPRNAVLQYIFYRYWVGIANWKCFVATKD